LEFLDSKVVSNIKWNKQEKKKKVVAGNYKEQLHQLNSNFTWIRTELKWVTELNYTNLSSLENIKGMVHEKNAQKLKKNIKNLSL